MSPPIPHDVRQALSDYRGRLEQRFGERLVDFRLFGSHARGEAHEDSDVDVLVVVEGLTERERVDAIDDWVTVAMATGVALEPLVMSTARLDSLRRSERLLARVLDEEGIRL